MASTNAELGWAFWNTDLAEIEAGFLKGRRVTELPVHLTEMAPPQGSVLLEEAIDIENEMARDSSRSGKPSLWLRIAGLCRRR